MRHMNWSYDQLLNCPVDYLDIISEEAEREAYARRAAERHR